MLSGMAVRYTEGFAMRTVAPVSAVAVAIDVACVRPAIVFAANIDFRPEATWECAATPSSRAVRRQYLAYVRSAARLPRVVVRGAVAIHYVGIVNQPV